MHNNHKILRAIDANINRTNEALRVVEDCLRFVLVDSHLTNVCKRLRHEFAKWTSHFDRQNLLAMRDASADVGHQTDVKTEYERAGVTDVLQANLSRCQQALRVLEELSKTLDSRIAIEAEQIRYKIYDLEKAAILLVGNIDRLKNVRLYALIDTQGGNEDEFKASVRRLVDSGVDAIQLRDKKLSDQQLVRFAEILQHETKDEATLAIINDRVDVAVAVGADGVHLGQDDMDPAEARKIAGSRMLIGVSTHDIQQVHAAVKAGANYIGVGPTFPSDTKQFEHFSGLDFLRAVSAEATIPAFAIGGISLENLSEIVACGIHRVAISAALNVEESQLQQLVQGIKSKLDSGSSKQDAETGLPTNGLSLD